MNKKELGEKYIKHLMELDKLPEEYRQKVIVGTRFLAGIIPLAQKHVPHQPA